jgi:hypothetical protein
MTAARGSRTFRDAPELVSALDRVLDNTHAHDGISPQGPEFAEFMRRELHAAADQLEPLPGGAERIRARIRARASSGSAREERRAEVRVAPAAGRLATAAARVLPTRERVRYAEEFQAELWEIARAGGGRWLQLGYAARQVMAAPRLRVGLRVPRRRGAVL